MPTPATNGQRLTLVAIAVASVVLAVLSFGALNAASVAAARPIPAGDLRRLSAYLAPLPETSLDVPANGSMLRQADPFDRPARTGGASTGTVGSSAPVSIRDTSPKWVVSSILFEDSKRSAIVNDVWVSVGDALAGGARLTAIERKFVVVTDAKGTRQVVPIRGARDEN